MGTEECVTY